MIENDQQQTDISPQEQTGVISSEGSEISFDVISANPDAVRMVFANEEAAYQLLSEFWQIKDPSLMPHIRGTREVTSGDRTIIESS